MTGSDSQPDEPLDDTQAIARAAREGDQTKFAELYERIAPALYAWASLRIRPAMRAWVDPQDVVQEVWVRAWRAFPAFEVESASFRAWIFRIAKNVLLEGFRKVQRLSPGGGAAGPTTRLYQLQELPDHATRVSERVARDDNLRHVLAYVEGLAPEEQELFVHCGLEGMSYADAAERMSLQRDTVAKRWQSLRERVGRHGLPKALLLAE
jgi:RNA polymerase sigma factor (sigma-70 family)